MAAPTTAAAYILMRRPSLSGDTRTPDLILFCEDKLSEAWFGDRYFEAVGLLVLHMIEMSESATNQAGGNRGGTGGAVTSESEGRLSRSYDLSKLTGYASSWNTTSWGVELTQLSASRSFAARNRMM
jgi:hypothetical protein